jgi:hypothetical protein
MKCDGSVTSPAFITRKIECCSNSKAVGGLGANGFAFVPHTLPFSWTVFVGLSKPGSEVMRQTSPSSALPLKEEGRPQSDQGSIAATLLGRQSNRRRWAPAAQRDGSGVQDQ